MSRTQQPAAWRVSRVATVLNLLACLGHPSLALAVNPAAVKLAWNASPDPSVIGYRIYYGAASGNYTNSITLGKTNSATISSLANGTTYYFATTAYTAVGAESSFSNEATYRVAFSQVQKVELLANQSAAVTLAGQPGHAYNIEASQTLSSWTNIGTVTVGSNGTATFTDANATNYAQRFYRLRDTTP